MGHTKIIQGTFLAEAHKIWKAMVKLWNLFTQQAVLYQIKTIPLKEFNISRRWDNFNKTEKHSFGERFMYYGHQVSLILHSVLSRNRSLIAWFRWRDRQSRWDGEICLHRWVQTYERWLRPRWGNGQWKRHLSSFQRTAMHMVYVIGVNITKL